MQISLSNYSVTPYSVPNFTARVVDEVNKPIEGKKVFKNATKWQIGAFTTYILTKDKDYHLGMTPVDVQNLMKYDGDDFILNSYLYLTDKLGFHEKIRPALMPAEFPPGADTFMQYIPANNIIQFNQDYVTKVDKIDIFTALRHELQHYKQNMEILRHEEYGEKAIDAYTKNFIQMQKTILENLYDSNKIMEFLKPGVLPDQKAAALIYAYKCFKDAKNDKALDMMFNQMGKEYQVELLKFRDKVRSEYGVIKSDDSATPKIGRMYDEFNNVGYFKQNHELDYNKYVAAFIEQDAILAQLRAGFEFANEACFIRYMRNEYERTMKNDFLRTQAEKIDMNI